MAGAAGFEPTTPGFGDQCSTGLSYAPLQVTELVYRLRALITSVTCARLECGLGIEFGCRGIDNLRFVKPPL